MDKNKQEVYKCINPRHRETGLKFPCKTCVLMEPKQENKECNCLGNDRCEKCDGSKLTNSTSTGNTIKLENKECEDCDLSKGYHTGYHKSQRPKKEECEHEPTGKWEVKSGKSYADCRKCGTYETNISNIGKDINAPSKEVTKESMEERFNKNFFVDCGMGLILPLEKSRELKDFIKKEITKVEQKVKEGIREKIEAMKKKVTELSQEDDIYRGLELIHQKIDKSYNQALEDLLKHLD